MLYYPHDMRDSTTLCIPVPVALDGQAIKDQLSHILRFGKELILSYIYPSTIYPSYRHKPTMEDAVVSQKMTAILWTSMLVHLPVTHDGIQEG